MSTAVPSLEQSANTARIAMERYSQRLVTAFIASGMFFMLLPGTFLGVWNLVGISQQHALASVPAELLAQRDLPKDLVRISVGIEDEEDLLADLDRAILSYP